MDARASGILRPILKQSIEKRSTMLKNAKRGYTFFEIMVVLVMASIILVIIISRFSTADVELSAQSEIIKTHLRFAQAAAMSTDTVWGLHCNNASTYWLFRDGNIANRIHLPAEDNDSINLGTEGFSLEAFTLAFDSWGIPYTDAAATAGQELIAVSPAADITLTYSGNSKTISITPNTGFVP
jgi:MSHA pilin protein MshC